MHVVKRIESNAAKGEGRYDHGNYETEGIDVASVLHEREKKNKRR
jgi:hypothetical protein